MKRNLNELVHRCASNALKVNSNYYDFGAGEILYHELDGIWEFSHFIAEALNISVGSVYNLTEYIKMEESTPILDDFIYHLSLYVKSKSNRYD